jgi:hypothetical protein
VTWSRALTVLAVVAAGCLLSLVLNPGFYNHDELVLLHTLRDDVWFASSWLTNGAGLFYRPLGDAAFRLQLGATVGFAQAVHTISVAHHALNLFLLASLFRRLDVTGPAVRWSLILPTAIPGVAWVAAVYDRLALTWLLLAALTLTMRNWRSWSCVPLFALALMTKETSIVFVVPAWCLVLVSHRQSHDRRVLLLGALLTAMTALFVLWRLAVGDTNEAYTIRFDVDAAIRLARYCAFCFALGAEDPRTVWGLRWLGAIGMVVLAWLAWRGDRRLSAIGVMLFTAPLAIVCGLPKVEGHSLYLALPGLTLMSLAAWRVGGRPARCLLAALAAVAVVHGCQLATFYHRSGAVMDGLVRAYERAPVDVPVIDVVCEPGAPRWVAERFVRHAELSRLSPMPRLCTASTDATWLLLDASGTTQLRSR